MFKVIPAQTFSWPVKVQVPVDGRHVEQSFQGKFKVIERERIMTVTPGDVEADTALMREVFVGWDGVADEQGSPLAFSETTRDQLLEIPYVRSAITGAFTEGIFGRKAKN